MSLSSLLNIIENTDKTGSVMPYLVKKGTLCSQMKTMGADIKSLFTVTPVALENRLSVINSTKHLYPVRMTKLEGYDDVLIVGIFEKSETSILYFTLRVQSIKVDEFKNLDMEKITERVCKMYEDLQFGALNDVNHYLYIQSGLGLISTDLHHSILDDLLNTEKRISEKGQELYHIKSRDKYKSEYNSLIATDPLTDIVKPKDRLITRDFNHLLKIEHLVKKSVSALISSLGYTDPRGYAREISQFVFLTSHLENSDRLGKFDFMYALKYIADESEMVVLQKAYNKLSKFNVTPEAFVKSDSSIPNTLLFTSVMPLVFELILTVTKCNSDYLLELLVSLTDKLGASEFDEINKTGTPFKDFIIKLLGILKSQKYITEEDFENYRIYVEINLEDLIKKLN